MKLTQGIARSFFFAGCGLLLAIPASAEEGAGIGSLPELLRLVRWSGVVTSILLVVGVLLVLRFLDNLLERLGRQFADRRLTLQKLGTMVRFFVYVATALLVFLLSFRLDNRVLALIGGTLAVAVGFAVKDVIASFIAGILIMVDHPFQVGDRVSLVGQYGDVIAIGLRSVRLRTLDDNVVTIPNNRFLDEISSSGNYGALHMMVPVDFHIGIDQDVFAARRIVTEAAATSRYVYLPMPIAVRVDEVALGSVVAFRLRVKPYVLDTRYETSLRSDLTLRVHEAFRREGIGPPAMLHRQLERGAETASDLVDR